jgi:hypothetical protein
MAGDGEGDVAEGLVQAQAMIGGVGFRQQRVAAALRPVEIAGIDDHAAHRVAVPAHELGERMQHDVGAMFDRLAEIGRGQRVVDDQRHAGLLRDLRDAADVGDEAAGIGDRLDEDGLGLGRQRLLDGG